MNAAELKEHIGIAPISPEAAVIALCLAELLYQMEVLIDTVRTVIPWVKS